MEDELLSYYLKELNYMRRSAAEFAQANPSAASRLRISSDSIEDPHVERLIQAVSFLNGRIRKKLDDSYPEFIDSILNLLYPSYLNPIPSMSIVKFSAKAGLTEDYVIRKGTMLETDPVDGEPLSYQLGYPVTLWPFSIVSAELVEGAYKAPPPPAPLSPSGIIRLVLQTDAEDIHFSSLKLDDIRMYLRGSNVLVNSLYQTLLNNVCAVAIADSPWDEKAEFISPEAIMPVGFDVDEILVPKSDRTFSGYSLLNEYFVFPQKFNFIDITGLHRKLKGRREKIEIYFYLNKTVPELSNNITFDTFSLGCAPVINLFKQTVDPIKVTDKCVEFKIEPDARRKEHKEILEINSVKAINPVGGTIPIEPYYGYQHHSPEKSGIYWHTTRRNSEGGSLVEGDKGTELMLNIVDDNYFSCTTEKWVIQIEATCFNRELPKRLPFGGGAPFMKLRDGGLVEKIECIVPPTATIRPSNKSGNRWKLLSQMGLSHIPLFKNENAVESIRELLKIYDNSDTPATSTIVSSIHSVKYKQIASRVRTRTNSALCRGIEISLTIDEGRMKDQSAFLLGSILEKFFSNLAPINSFTKLVLFYRQQKEPIKTWIPRLSSSAIE